MLCNTMLTEGLLLTADIKPNQQLLLQMGFSVCYESWSDKQSNSESESYIKCADINL